MQKTLFETQNRRPELATRAGLTCPRLFLSRHPNTAAGSFGRRYSGANDSCTSSDQHPKNSGYDIAISKRSTLRSAGAHFQKGFAKLNMLSLERSKTSAQGLPSEKRVAETIAAPKSIAMNMQQSSGAEEDAANVQTEAAKPPALKGGRSGATRDSMPARPAFHWSVQRKGEGQTSGERILAHPQASSCRYPAIQHAARAVAPLGRLSDS